jgi:hypothetical protein
MRRAFVGIAVAFAAAACSGKSPYRPGTPLGTFHVTGKLGANQCGAGSGAADPWEFDVKLSRDGDTLYWIQGGLPVAGTLDASAHTTMTSTDTRTIHDADPQHHIPFCGMTRDDSVDMTLAGDATSFSGELVYRFSESDGSDCSDQLAPAGGAFDTLPCSIHYAITSVRTVAPPASSTPP